MTRAVDLTPYGKLLRTFPQGLENGAPSPFPTDATATTTGYSCCTQNRGEIGEEERRLRPVEGAPGAEEHGGAGEVGHAEAELIKLKVKGDKASAKVKGAKGKPKPIKFIKVEDSWYLAI